MRTIPFNADGEGIHHHYCQKGGYMPVFSGNAIQRGSGLGQILAGLAKSAIPILTNTLLPAAIRTGKEVLSDVVTKKRGIKQALLASGKKRVSEFLESVPETNSTSRNRSKKARIVKRNGKQKHSAFAF